MSKVKAPRSGRPTPLQLARLLRGAAVDKKAWDAVVMDVRDKTSVAEIGRASCRERVFGYV